jgi:hypothetical protein
MATVLPYIAIGPEYSELLVSWWDRYKEVTKPDHYPFPNYTKEDIDEWFSGDATGYGCGFENTPQAITMSRRSRMFAILVNPKLSNREQPLAFLSVSYWTLVKKKSEGHTTIFWEQSTKNPFWKWYNRQLPPINIDVAGRNPDTGTPMSEIVVLDVNNALKDCINKLTRLGP